MNWIRVQRNLKIPKRIAIIPTFLSRNLMDLVFYVRTLYFRRI